jgi:ABC-type branched-subunit amino acid transport system substrate-binding protein
MQGFNAGARIVIGSGAADDSNGVSGRQIRLVSLDDVLNAERAATNYQSLIYDHRVVACFGPAGSNTTAAGLPILRQTSTPAVGGYGMAGPVRDAAAVSAVS